MILQEGDVQFQHRNRARQSGDQQATVKDDGEKMAERHLRKDGWHRHEREARTGSRFKTKGEHGRHHHQGTQDGAQNR